MTEWIIANQIGLDEILNRYLYSLFPVGCFFVMPNAVEERGTSSFPIRELCVPETLSGLSCH